MFSKSLLQICCFYQIKAFTSVMQQHVNNIFAITIKITFVMPYNGLIVYFEFKGFTRLEISTPLINAIQLQSNYREKNPTSLTGGGRVFSSNSAFFSIFC